MKLVLSGGKGLALFFAFLATVFFANTLKAQGPGEYLNFSGSNNRVRGPIELIPAFNGAYSFQAWARYANPTFGSEVCIAAQSRNFYIASSVSGKIILGDGDTTAVSFPTDAAWHNYTVVNSQTDFRLYLDGILVYSKGAPKAGPYATQLQGDTSGRFYIGTDWSGINRYFQGDIDEVKVWNRELGISEIQANLNCEVHHQGGDLIANYHFNQGTDAANNTAIQFLIDSSSFQNDLLLEGFTFAGSTSNFLAGSVIASNVACTTFCLPAENPQNIDIPNPCRGLSTSLSVTQANLNNATTWYWYADSCGGTLVDTGVTIQYIPNSSITTLYVRGEGGCALPGQCGFASFYAPTGPELTFTSSHTESCDSINGSGTITILVDQNNYDGTLYFRLKDSVRDQVQLVTESNFVNLKGGTYFFNLSTGSGCYDPGATDTIRILELPLYSCIVPDFTPPDSGYVPSPLGATLTQIIIDTSIISNTQDNPGNSFETMGGKVLIDVIAADGQRDNLLALLQTPTYGLTTLYPNGEDSLTLTGFYPVSKLSLLAALYPSMLRFAEVNRRPLNNGEEQGVAISQGDYGIQSYNAREGYRIGGSNIKIGVLSNSYNTQPGDQASIDVSNYDLPGIANIYNSNPVEVLQDFPYGVQSDEGRAMLQIVHDVAPDAKLAFKTGFITSGHFAESIIALANDSCDVIVDDITYVTEPFFTDGLVAKAVNEVAAKGVAYFSAAGNFGKSSYEGNFNAAPAPAGFTGEAHDFGGGDVMQSVTLKAGVYSIVMQWEDSIYSLGQLSGAASDLDIYLLDKDGNLLFGFNRDNNGEDPIELLPFVVKGTIDANILVLRRSGNTPVRFKYIVFRGDLSINEFNQNTGTCVGQANAEGAMSVASVLYTNTPYYGQPSPTVSSFSSRGGVLADGTDRQKPDFAAPNGVNTTVNMGGVNIDGDIFPNFFGTSCAAPHAAGAAALVLQAKKKFDYEKMTPEELRSLLKSSSLDMYDSGYDLNSGAGMVLVDSAIGRFAAPTPRIDYLYNTDYSLTPGAQPITAGIWASFISPETKVIFQYDTLTPVTVYPGYLQVTIPAFVGNPPVYLYTPPISNSMLDGGNSDSAYFFYTPSKNVVVIVENKSKKYGESLPTFSFKVTIDGISNDSLGISLDSLGLNDVVFNTPATSGSNVGNYFIKASSAVTDLSHPRSLLLAETYNYSFVNGILSVNKMPVHIRPADTTLIYGDKIGNFQYAFDYIDSLIPDADKAAFLNNLRSEYVKDIAPAVALVDSRVTVDGRSLTDADLAGLSFLVSWKALINERSLVNWKALINNISYYDTTNIIDLSVRSIFNYQENQDTTTLEPAYPLTSWKALINSYSLVNGSAVVNWKALINSESIANWKALINSTTIPDSGSNQPVAIIDEDDVNAPAGDSLNFLTINLITGTHVGTHRIVPAAFASPNFEPYYELGTLTITPALLVVTAKDTTAGCNGEQPSYASTISRKYVRPDTTLIVPGYCYDDNEDSVFSAMAMYKVYDAGNNLMGTTPLAAGHYTITPYGAQLKQPSNYLVEYADGKIKVNTPLSLSDSLGEMVCAGQKGYLFFKASGGLAPYTYTVNGLSAASPYTLDTSGSYVVKVTDANHCADSSTLNYSFAVKSKAPTSVSATQTTVTAGSSSILSVNGGSIGTGASWKWYSGSCGGTAIGSGSSILVTPGSTTTYFARAEGMCDTTSCVSITITVGVCGPTGILSSESGNTICSGNSVYLTAQGTLQSGADWSWFKTSCGSTKSTNKLGDDSTIKVTPTATTTYYLRSEGGSCGTTSCISITINVKTVPSKPGSITGNSFGLCSKQNIAYTITPVTGATSYFWAVPVGASIVSGQGSTSIVVNFGNKLSTGMYTSSNNICVRANNDCGASAWSCLTISLSPVITGTISGPSSLLANKTGTFSISPAFGATNYTWSVSSGWSVVSGQGTTSVVVKAGKNSGYVRVTPSNACGSGPYVSKSVSVAAARGMVNEEKPGISVWPNPTISEINLYAGNIVPTGIEILDNRGRSLYHGKWTSSLNVSAYPPGIYLLKVKTSEGIITKKIVIASQR